MIYLANFLLPLTFLMLLSSAYKKIPDFYLLLAVLFLVMLPAFQYEVGTDYHSYRKFYFDPYKLDWYRNKYERVFTTIYDFVIAADLGPQLFFAIYSILNMFILFLTLRILKDLGFDIVIVFFLFAFATSFYFNQMNGIRQYAAGSVSVLCMLYSLTGRPKTAILAVIYSMGQHLTGLINMVPYITSFFIVKRRLQLIIFLVSPIMYFIILPAFITEIVESFLPIYRFYLTSDYASGIGLLNVLTRVYDLPLILLFWICYLSGKSGAGSQADRVLNVGITVFCLTHFTYLASIKFGFFFRLEAFFMLYKIFPLYYLLNYLRNRNEYVTALTFLYISFPLVMKVVIFPSGEYLYKAIGY